MHVGYNSFCLQLVYLQLVLSGLFLGTWTPPRAYFSLERWMERRS